MSQSSTDWSEIAADVLIIGELHDNPEHHVAQQSAVNEIAAKAVVFEMLTPQEADALANVDRTPQAMRAAIDGYHWSNIADYAGVLASSSVIVGAALPREKVRAAFQDGAAAHFGPLAEEFGLSSELPEAELERRKDVQFKAHCEAMPLAMMDGMVEAQRLRDASFARAVIEAIDRYGTPVVLITGNFHARQDWGVPVYLDAARPDLDVVSVGQGEGGVTPKGEFSWTQSYASVPERDDPCAVFR